jgi:hypothetical protein
MMVMGQELSVRLFGFAKNLNLNVPELISRKELPKEINLTRFN